MGWREYLTERMKPQLPIRPEIVKREMEFSKWDEARESWVLDHIYLCEGDLQALRQHPDFDAAGQGIECIIALYEAPQGKRGPCRKVKVNIPLRQDRGSTMDLVEKKLKLELHSRGCNAGVFYRRYQKNDNLYAEAIPATLSGE